MNEKDIIREMNKYVKLGLLEKRSIMGEIYYKDSKKVTSLLKQGLTRKEIFKMLTE